MSHAAQPADQTWPCAVCGAPEADDHGCVDCGDCPCTCDDRCRSCAKKYQWDEERATGLCRWCEIDCQPEPWTDEGGFQEGE